MKGLTLPRFVLVCALALFGSLAIACAGDGYKPPAPDASALLSEEAARIDCKDIMGTPFRSADERAWFTANCSKWPPTNFGDLAASKARSEPAECAPLRGKPYTSDGQRQWFLANCIGAPNPVSASAASSLPGTPGGSTANRADCNAIQGTAYQSTVERTWYLTYCNPAQAQVGQLQATQPQVLQPLQPSVVNVNPPPGPAQPNACNSNGRTANARNGRC